MNLSADELRRLAALPTEALPEVLNLLADRAQDEEIVEAEIELERIKERERKRNYRGTKAGQTRDKGGTNAGQDDENSPPLFPSHTLPITPPLSQKPENTPRARGTRLPDGFYPSLETIDAIIAELGPLPDGFILRETNKFRDYWQAKAGADATKLDWVKTWRNWMRKAFEDRRSRLPWPAAPPRETGAMRAGRELIAEAEERERNEQRKTTFNFEQPARARPLDEG